MRIRYQQLLYWSTIGYDVLLGGFSKSYYVVGYAKSGTNWLCRLLSDYTGLPVYEPWKHLAPRLGPQIFHMMRLLPFEPARKRSVYIMRDGRDTMISRYYETIHREPEHRRAAERFLGHEMTDDNIREQLPRFIEFMSTFQGGCADYKSHLNYWLAHDYRVTVRYEDLLSDTIGQMRRVLRELTGHEPDITRLEHVVQKNSFEARAQRARGQESKGEFLRKGVSGDWKNYFTPQAARVFDEYAGDLLIRLGYERNKDWIEQVRASA
jgi:hypothetical protein